MGRTSFLTGSPANPGEERGQEDPLVAFCPVTRLQALGNLQMRIQNVRGDVTENPGTRRDECGLGMDTSGWNSASRSESLVHSP